jgi:uncharacterized protein YndB with AHSA1/START domain
MNPITVTTTISAPVERVWRSFTDPSQITAWNNASDDWHTTRATNDLRVGGSFDYRMEARDGSIGFNFIGTYDEIVPTEKITYTMADGRKAVVTFKEEGGITRVTETFDPENENSIEMQRGGWQAILDNLKKHVEAS